MRRQRSPTEQFRRSEHERNTGLACHVGTVESCRYHVDIAYYNEYNVYACVCHFSILFFLLRLGQ